MGGRVSSEDGGLMQRRRRLQLLRSELTCLLAESQRSSDRRAIDCSNELIRQCNRLIVETDAYAANGANSEMAAKLNHQPGAALKKSG